MTGYAMERLGAERLRELRDEAAGSRLIETRAVERDRVTPWRARLTQAVLLRLIRVGGAA